MHRAEVVLVSGSSHHDCYCFGGRTSQGGGAQIRFEQAPVPLGRRRRTFRAGRARGAGWAHSTRRPSHAGWARSTRRTHRARRAPRAERPHSTRRTHRARRAPRAGRTPSARWTYSARRTRGARWTRLRRRTRRGGWSGGWSHASRNQELCLAGWWFCEHPFQRTDSISQSQRHAN